MAKYRFEIEENSFLIKNEAGTIEVSEHPKGDTKVNFNVDDNGDTVVSFNGLTGIFNSKSQENVRYIYSTDTGRNEILDSDGNEFSDLATLKTWLRGNLGKVNGGGSSETTAGDSYLGAEVVVDTTYTSASPFTVTGATAVTLPNNGGGGFKALPDGIDKLYDPATNKLVGVNNLDFFEIEIRGMAESTANGDFFDVSIDIGGSQGVITGLTAYTSKNSGEAKPFAIDLDYYTGTTFLANGGEIKITKGSGDLTIYDIVYVIRRVQGQKNPEVDDKKYREIKEVSENYTLTSGDTDKILHFTNTTDITVTVPAGVDLAKGILGIVKGTGNVTITEDTGVDVRNKNGLITNGQYSVFSIDKLDDDEYLAYGDLKES